MVHVKKYHLPPTALVPNSPFPLLHYPGLLLANSPTPTTAAAVGGHTSPGPDQNGPVPALRVYDLFSQNGWQVQWVFRYGPTQDAHYHAAAHEAMAVLSGEATIRFGASDEDGHNVPSSSSEAEAEAEAEEDDDDGFPTASSTTLGTRGGVVNNKDSPSPPPLELRAQAGDVFVLPAGVAHKTFATRPASGGLKLLTPGDGHRMVVGALPPKKEGQEQGSEDNEDPTRQVFTRLRLEGFTMMGAYPLGGGEWDFNTGGEHRGRYGEVWGVPRPERDPVLGKDPGGLCGLWSG